MNFNQFLSAEREGFEPPEPLSSTVFKTAAIDHSAISPCIVKCIAFSKALQRYNSFFICQTFRLFFYQNILKRLTGML